MPQDATEELIRLCASILDDDEVTVDEAYHLADWLNNHRGATELWPGRELIRPLQEIWADGSVNKRELHRLARILVSVQREWARHPKTEISPVTEEAIPTLTQAEIDDARLPSLSGKFRVPSQSNPNTFYEVDLVGPSCTCPDWRSRRSRLPKGDLTRCCKHVLHVYATLPRRGARDGWLYAFADNGWPAHPTAEWHLMTLGSDKVLFCTASAKGWANVFAKEAGEYSRFGYNVDEARWAYGSKPEGAREIAHAIAHAIAFPKTGGVSHAQTANGSAPHLLGSAANRRSKLLIWVGMAVPIGICLVVIARAVLNSTSFQAKTRIIPSVGRDKKASARAEAADASGALSQSPVRAAPTRSSSPWNAKTIRAVRVKVDRREIEIPRDAQLRIIARSGIDVMASYQGLTVTIPVSATDLK